MSPHTIGIIVHGATGRIGSTQHLKNSLIAMRDEGGLAVGDKQVVPRPMLVSRNAARLAVRAVAPPLRAVALHRERHDEHRERVLQQIVVQRRQELAPE